MTKTKIDVVIPGATICVVAKNNIANFIYDYYKELESLNKNNGMLEALLLGMVQSASPELLEKYEDLWD